jgi:hypothetical protein
MELEALDPEYVQERLSQPPFVTIDGVHNARDLGLYSTQAGSLVTKPRLAYRSAELSSITEQGMRTVQSRPSVHTF